MSKIRFIRQMDSMDCGPTCLKMIAEYYGKNYSLEHLRSQSHFSRNGVSLKGIMTASESLGFRSLPVEIPLKSTGNKIPSLSDAPLPCIVRE